MRIRNIQLNNFRNYKKFSHSFNDKGAIVTGNNGSGKTNLLEAIAYFAFGKSFRARNDSDLINFGESYFRIKADMHIRSVDINLAAGFDNKNKIIKIDGEPVRKVSSLYQNFKVISFEPDDINIINGSPSIRRKFFDLAVSQYSFRYLQVLGDFHKTLKQRNALLKSEFTIEEKKVWDDAYIQACCEIYEERSLYLEDFRGYLLDFFKHFFSEIDSADIEYAYSISRKEGITSEEYYQDACKRFARKEKETGRTLFGIHLDDYIIKLNELPAKFFASQGQKRVFALILKMIHAKVLAEKNNEFPVLIFDDVLAELDQTRIEKFREFLNPEHQVFIASPRDFGEKYFNLDVIDLNSVLQDYIDER